MKSKSEIKFTVEEYDCLCECVTVAGKSFKKGLGELARIPGITQEDLKEYEKFMVKQELKYYTAKNALERIEPVFYKKG